MHAGLLPHAPLLLHALDPGCERCCALNGGKCSRTAWASSCHTELFSSARQDAREAKQRRVTEATSQASPSSAHQSNNHGNKLHPWRRSTCLPCLCASSMKALTLDQSCVFSPSHIFSIILLFLYTIYLYIFIFIFYIYYIIYYFHHLRSGKKQQLHKHTK